MKKWTVLAIILLLILTGCGSRHAGSPTASPSLILGADVSSLISLENSGVVYHDFDGQQKDLLDILSQAGVNCIRVRVWNDPYDGASNGYGGGNCDLSNAIALGKRAKEYGMGLLVDFHYSDFWADPGKQQAPKAWQSMTFEEKKQSIYDYTAESIRTMEAQGTDLWMVQIGNETTAGFCGETSVSGQYTLMASAAKAVRDVNPQIQIVVHYTNPESLDYGYFADKLREFGVEYDIFATSYYPHWHGSLENLKSQLQTVVDGSGKKVMIAETSWAYTPQDTDGHQNSVSADHGGHLWPMTRDGQAQALTDIIKTMESFGSMNAGVFYWEPGWIAVPGGSWEERSLLWETWGSGWASSFAGEYDPEDAGRYYGGSACDNQALFDSSGNPLPALRCFSTGGT
jgi:arabinogalactan endo-1,4-beta-galactosidase